MASEESFGIIPLVFRDNMWQVLCVNHVKGHWGFPKGHKDFPEEEDRVAAERELDEETGLKVVHYLPFGPLHEHYTYDGIDKRVTFFLAEVTGTLSVQPEEVISAIYLPLDQAEGQMTFPGAQELCHKTRLLLETLNRGPGE